MSLLSWKLAQRRLGRHAFRLAAAATVVTFALLSLMTLQGISYSSSNSLVTYALSDLPAGDRALTISSNRILASSKEYESANAYLAKNLPGLATGGLFREVLYHELSDAHGAGFNFGAVDGLAKLVALKTGRLPRACTPMRCEVLQVGGGSSSTPHPDSLGLAVVGRGEFLDTGVFKGTFASSPGVPILVADGINAASSLPTFESLQGSDGWVGQIDLRTIENAGLSRYLNSLLAFENQLSLDHSELTLTWPEDSLSMASAKTSDLHAKSVLLAYDIWVLLAAFLIVFSLRYKREHFEFRAGLSRIGTPKRVLAAELGMEYATPLLLGIAAATLLSPMLLRILDRLHFHAGLIEIYQGWQGNIMFLFAAFSATTVFALVGDQAWRRLIWIPAGTTIFFFGLASVISGQHASRTFGIPLVSAAMVVVVGHYGLRWSSSNWRNKDANAHALLRENFGVWHGAAAILALATLLAVITLSFNSGIQHSVKEQADNQVPLSISIKTGPALIRPLDVAGLPDYERLASGATVFPILRVGSSIRTQGLASESVSVIGIPPAEFSKMSDRSLRNLSKTIAPTISVTEPGLNIGSSAQMEVQLSHIPKQIDLLAWFRTPRGTHASFVFAGHDDRRMLTLHGQVPSDSTLVAFEFRETSDYLSRRLHAMGEGAFSVPVLKGAGSILEVSLDRHPQSLSRQGWGFDDFPYSFDGGSLYIRPSQPLEIPRVVVDSATAQLARNRDLTLSAGGGTYFQVRVGAIRPFFPSAGDHFVILDLTQLQQELARVNPGSVDPIEVWVSTDDPDNYLKGLAARTFQGLDISSHSDELVRLRTDPINIGLDRSYQVAFLLALLLAIFMYSTVLPLLRRESEALFYHLEVGGAGPKVLRKTSRKALRLALAVGVLVGLGTGLVVSWLFVSRSIPFAEIAFDILLAVAASEVGSRILTRNFFGESTMVEAKP